MGLLLLEKEIMEDRLLQIDELLTVLKRQKGNEGIDRLFAEYMKTQSKIEELISDSHYIEWLDQFTKEHHDFDDKSWISRFKNVLDDTNRKQINNLYYFYIGICQYAQLNNYESSTSSLVSYDIRFNDFYFSIGRSHGDLYMETFVSRRKPYKPDMFEDSNLSERYKQQFIDFNEIISNFRQYKSDQVSKQLCILSSLAKTIHKNGVPVKSIIDTVDSTLTSVSQIEDEPKKLTRKQCN